MLHPRAITTYIHRMQDSTCWRDQRAYRVEFAALLTYMILAVLAAIGLESFSLGLRPVVAAVHVLAVTLVIPLFCSLFFPLPNQLFIAYSYFTVQGAAISRLLQVVLWIDFSYDLNDTLFGHARDVHRRTISGALHKGANAGIVVTSLLLVAGSVAASVHLCIRRPGLTWIVCCAMILSLACLLVSISDWCEHGSLLCSSVVMIYMVYLCYDADKALPVDHDMQAQRDFTPVGVIQLFGTLIYYGICYGLGTHLTGSSEDDPDRDACDLIVRCLVHAAASCYICAGLATHADMFRGVICIGVVFAAVILYGWTLVAPKFLTDRSF